MSKAQEIRQLVVVRIDAARGLGNPVTSEKIREWVDQALDWVDPSESLEPVDPEQLAREIEAEFNVHVGTWNSLNDDTDHIPWLDQEYVDNIQWPFWARYRRYLGGEQGMPPEAVARLDEITRDILSRLEEPGREGPWDRRGLVAGQVQSGKTGNYIGLIAKAIDAGYKLVVVLAGVHNSLRSQTQSRLDEGILGFDTRAFRLAFKAEESSRIGVGKLAGARLYVNSFTSSAENGDFQLRVAQNIGVAPGGADPIVLVIKKNKSILTNLFKWATELTKEKNPETGQFKVRGIPVLVIDDEADHASVNTKSDDPETDPSAINGLIRKILNTFDRTAYVAYTATPFANIFIDPEADHDTWGQDLFPRSFIVNLPAASTYVGPERVFGLREDVASAIDEVEPLPIVRHVNDYGTWLPDGHKSGDQLSGELPESVREAIDFFLMSGAARRVRGQQRKHHSMLIHVTRFTAVQRQVADQVAHYLDDVTRRLAYGEGANPVFEERIRRLYDTDLVPTSDALAVAGLGILVGPAPSFDELWTELHETATKTLVHVVNGTSADALEYVDQPEGVSVIAIGGDKLSRGLTLEGLTVSYYLRASRMYDTLMQMGRWFGYRPGYLDVCRLYTTQSLSGWYERITAASAELQREFDAMAVLGRTPADFGLRVRQLPDGLMVTSPSKLRNAQRLRISFSGQISETVTYRATDRAMNLASLETMVARLGAPEAKTGLYVWRDVVPAHVVGFLSGYRADRAAVKAQPRALTEYINARVADDELTRWTVVVANSSTAERHATIAGLDIGLTERDHHNPKSGDGRYTVRRVVSPRHELVDIEIDAERWEHALQITIDTWENNPRRKPDSQEPNQPSGLAERKLRSDTDGLLIVYPLDASRWKDFDGDTTPFVGWAVSFPESATAEPIEYQVNPVMLKLEFGWDDEDFDD